MSRGFSVNAGVSEMHHSEKEVREAAVMSSPERTVRLSRGSLSSKSGVEVPRGIWMCPMADHIL